MAAVRVEIKVAIEETAKHLRALPRKDAEPADVIEYALQGLQKNSTVLELLEETQTVLASVKEDALHARTIYNRLLRDAMWKESTSDEALGIPSSPGYRCDSCYCSEAEDDEVFDDECMVDAVCSGNSGGSVAVCDNRNGSGSSGGDSD